MKQKLILVGLSLLFLTGCATTTHTDTDNIEELTVEAIAETTETIVSPALPEVITVKGEPVEIEKSQLLKPGDQLIGAPLIKPTTAFSTMEKVDFSSFTGYKVIHIVPSLDTPVCSLQTRILNSAASSFENVTFMTVSQDLPFALSRFATTNNILTMNLLSDYQGNSFAIENGLFMPAYQLNARALIITNPDNQVIYVEYVPEVTSEININNAINFLRQNVK